MWSANLRFALDKVNAEFVILLLEDFFFQEKIDTELLNACVDEFLGQDGNMLRLLPHPGPDHRVAGCDHIGKIEPMAPYRASTQGAIWRKKILSSILISEESAWEFERFGSRRSDRIPGFYCTWKAVLPYRHHVVERGKWFRSAASKFAKQDIGCDFNLRPTMTIVEDLKWRARKLYSFIPQAIPWKIRRRMRKLLRIEHKDWIVDA